MGLWGILKTSFKVAEIGVKTGVNVTRGAINTVSDVANTGSALLKGDTKRVEEIIGRRIENTINGVCCSVESAAVVIDRAITWASSESEKNFFDRDTERHIVRLASFAAAGSVAGYLIGDTDLDSGDASDYGEGLIADTNLSGIENGVFIGDSSDLNNLILAGQIEGTDHLDSDDYERDLSARNEFLAAHGFNSVPEGYEVHHIIPLCEGGADSPDNMVLIREEEHDIITAAHARFYNWGNT